MYEYVNLGAHPEDLDDGRVVGVRELVELTAEQLRIPHNQRLVAEGVLVPTGAKSEKEASLAERREARKHGEEE